jgi:hypothetical protein
MLLGGTVIVGSSEVDITGASNDGSLITSASDPVSGTGISSSIAPSLFCP